MSAAYAQLPYRSFRFCGEDALTFLQGQLTQDLTIVSNNRATYAAFCDHKALMFSNFLITGEKNNYVLRLSADIADTVIQRLKMFTLRAKVEVSECETVHLGCNEAAAAAIARSFGSEVPEIFSSTASETTTLVGLPNGYFEVSTTDVSALLATAPMNENTDAIQRLRLQGGHFTVTKDTLSRLLPQQTPLSQWGINYRKGCYVGQEVISRNKYKGKVRKALGFISIPTSLPVAVGTKVIIDERPMGQIIESYQGDADTYCLALMNIDSLDNPCCVDEQPVNVASICLD